MPVWDAYAGPGLEEALASLRAQDVAPRVVVVDNASNVAIPDRDGIDVVRSDERLVLGAARNLGLRQVSTPYVVMWDADDVMLPGTMRVLEEAMEADHGLAAFGAGIIEVPSGQRHRWPRRWVAALLRRPTLFRALHCAWSLFPSTGATIMRSDLVRDAGGYPPVETGDDWVLSVSLAFRGRLGWTERPGRIYRRHPQSVWARAGDARHLRTHAREVRARIRRDPGIGGGPRLALPLIALAQHAAILLSGLRRGADALRPRGGAQAPR